MRRVVVYVEEISRADGWMVAVRTADGDGALDLVQPYRMAATVVDGRRVPGTRPDRDPPVDGPHAPLCAGDVGLLAALLGRIRRGRPEPDDVSNYGRWLFECLLGEAWPAIMRHPDIERDHAVELALRWPTEASDLHRMVWESMRDATAPLAGHPGTAVAITRLVPADVQPVSTVGGVPSVLFATSVALTDPTIRPGAMYMGLLQELDAAGHCRARAATGVSADDLHQACAAWKPDLVHIVAHGVLLDGGRGALMLRGEDGGEQETDADGLIAALTTDGRRPMAVVLSACNTASQGESAPVRDTAAGYYSEPADPTDASPLAAQLVAQGIPVVSAMAGAVRESACRLYTRRLAAAVHKGLPVVQASAHGRRAALMASAAPSTEIDWALPAMFLAEYVDPDQALVDSTQADELTRVAGTLGLRREPVFIGRSEILACADAAVEPGSATGVVAVLATGSSSRRGGTRLLREIGWRALRDGHVPLLLGPYQEARGAPTHPRALVHAILGAIVSMTEKMGLSPFAPVALLDDLSSGDADKLRTVVELNTGATARAPIHKRLREFREKPDELIPAAVRDLLADDLAELAGRAAHRWGNPFGEASRVLLLCDDVHQWASGLTCLLDMVEPTTGLGRSSCPAPVVLTSSASEAQGKAVSEWCQNAAPGLRYFTMEDLTPEELVVGYQWVLLHPWRSKPVEERELFGGVYTPRPGSVARWEQNLRRLGGRPTIVEDTLYIAADQALGWETVSRDDDELAWTSYVEKNQGFGL